jgi:hypothetical protein
MNFKVTLTFKNVKNLPVFAISYYPKVNIFPNFGDPAKSALLDPPFFEEGYICQ